MNITDQLKKKQSLITITGDACSNMIIGVRQLRLSVLDLFSTLADNGPDPNRNHQSLQEISSNNKLYQQQILSNLATSHSLCTSAAPQLRIQKQREQQQQTDLIQYVNQMISTITAITRSLDQEITILLQNHALINPGESLNLAMECSQDKHQLYVDLCKSNKTYTKLHDYSTVCHALLHQQSLKRNHKRDHPSNAGASGGGIGLNSASSQSRDSTVATFNPYLKSLYKTSIGTMLENNLKMIDVIEGFYSQPFGSSTGVFQISVGRVLKAILVMRGIAIDAVIVKAYHESFASKASNKNNLACVNLLANDTPSGGQFVTDPLDDIDLWSESKYAVFRKLTHHANAAVLHFQYPTFPEIAVRSFLSWFSSHSDLFTATCSRCQSRLRKFMPPICRDFSTGFHPHHDSYQFNTID